MPGEVLLALLQKTGFQQLHLGGYTGMKSSPYTEGALISGEKPGLDLTSETARPVQEPPGLSPPPVSQPKPGGA